MTGAYRRDVPIIDAPPLTYDDGTEESYAQ